ncbi:MAG: hypothetical protein QOK43_2617 [Acidimicrobiaceae bacterium]|nr:hypothetical protein [Acidimicrobiaceae bacterium]MDQ1444876.1 hypothetical protein [Acidimicrobiaceae bacterium]
MIPARPSEAGFTVVETATASMLLLVVLTTLLGLLNTQTKAERRLRASVDNQEDVRYALVAIARDVRAADPLLPLATTATYRDTMELELKTTSGSHQAYVRWDFESASGVVRRQTLAAPGGSVTATTYSLSRVRNGDAGIPLFRYYNSAGTELTSTTATAADFANCTIRVHITLYADSAPGPQPFRSESDGELRNRLPGGVGC